LMMEQTQLKRLDNARAMAKNNPAAVAHIVRGWVNGETA
jgi:flagellar M-ring protein FliF